MLKTLSIVVVLVLVALLVVASRRPDVFRVSRTTRIAAPPQVVYGLVSDLQQFNTWNPYTKKDPQMKGRYSGPAQGPGATYEFEGNGQVGAGRIAITALEPPSRVEMQLTMLKPMAGENEIVLTLEPQGDGTSVTWAMQGATPLLGKLVGLFIDMDRMVGTDFERGLADLKSRAEARIDANADAHENADRVTDAAGANAIAGTRGGPGA